MRPTPRVSIASLALAFAACASSPATLVTLPAPPPPDANRAVAQSSGTSVLLRPVVLPGYLDNYPVVTGRTGSTLIVSNDTEWAEPLRDAVARVLRDALSRRLGASRVLIAGDGRIPDADLSTEFLALDPQQSTLRLDAKWTFSCTAGHRRSHAGRTVLEVPIDGTTPAAVAAATAEALGRLADVLATQAECEDGARER
ncbi:MAG: ABC-type transport auxiliary lipoprotein family protein [Terrimicrobiaceae bacterium]